MCKKVQRLVNTLYYSNYVIIIARLVVQLYLITRKYNIKCVCVNKIHKK